jgi:Pyridoxamine 5'-phosphate oxidase
MATKQGSVELLKDPLAQELLQSRLPARLGYNWIDGTPRVIPIWFHWNGSEVVFGTPTDAPKMRALEHGAKVALTIDTDTMPHKVLLIRGTIRTDTVEGLSPEYAAAGRRMLGEEGGKDWLDQAGALFPHMSRIFVTPECVGILDFESRFPSAIERAMSRGQ